MTKTTKNNEIMICNVICYADVNLLQDVIFPLLEIGTKPTNFLVKMFKV